MRVPSWLRRRRKSPQGKRTRVRQAAYARGKGVRFAEWPKTPPASVRETWDDTVVRRRTRR